MPFDMLCLKIQRFFINVRIFVTQKNLSVMFDLYVCVFLTQLVEYLAKVGTNILRTFYMQHW